MSKRTDKTLKIASRSTNQSKKDHSNRMILLLLISVKNCWAPKKRSHRIKCKRKLYQQISVKVMLMLRRVNWNASNHNRNLRSQPRKKHSNSQLLAHKRQQKCCRRQSLLQRSSRKFRSRLASATTLSLVTKRQLLRRSPRGITLQGNLSPRIHEYSQLFAPRPR